MISGNTIVSEANVAYVANRYIKPKVLKYIESTGTQYIDTGYIPNQNTKLEIEYFSGDSDPSNAICATYAYWLSPETFGLWNEAVGFGADVTFQSQDRDANHYYKINAVLSADGFYRNGIAIDTDLTYEPFTSNGSLYIFALHDANGNSYHNTNMRLYYLKLYENNTLVRDYIPMEQDGVVGLYDNVAQEFYTNDGTGSFVAGPEALLPSDYTELTYIAGNATSNNDGPYVDTGIKVTSKTSVICDFQFVNATNHIACNVFGSRDSNSTVRAYGFMYRCGTQPATESNGYWRFDYNSQSVSGTNTGLDKNRHTLTVFDGTLYFEDNLKMSPNNATFSANNTLWIMAYNSAGSVDGCANAKIYSFEIYDEGLNRYFVPAKRNSDNEIGMYELFTKNFYTNSNSANRDFTGGETAPQIVVNTLTGSDTKPAFLSTLTKYFKLNKVGTGPDRVLSISSLHHFVEQWKTNGFIMLEYLQSQATGQNDGPYIDTGMKVSSDAQILATFQFMDVSNHTHCVICGARGPASSYTNRFVMQYNSQGWRFDYYNANYSAKDSQYLNKLTVAISGRKAQFSSGVSLQANSATFEGQYNLYLFASNTGGSVGECTNLRIYSIKVIDGGVTKEFVPAKRASDGVLGMYDTVAKVFYTNAGTKLDFIAGPEL